MQPPSLSIAPSIVDDYKRSLYVREAKRLIGEIINVRAKSNADIAKRTAVPGYTPHSQDARVWGMNLRGAYGDTRQQAHSLKQLFVAELGIKDDYASLQYPFEECTQEDLGSNETKLGEGIRALELLIRLAYYNSPTK